MPDGSSLPSWLNFDPVTRVLAGQPKHSDIGMLELLVTARDNRRPSLSGTTTFSIDVRANLHPWQNPFNPLDANLRDGVTPLDALLLINYLNIKGSEGLPVPPTEDFLPPPFFDVAGNDLIAPRDVLFIINLLNGLLKGEGEAERHGDLAPKLDLILGSVMGVQRALAHSKTSTGSESVSDAWEAAVVMPPVAFDSLVIGQAERRAGDPQRATRIAATDELEAILDELFGSWI